MINKMAVLKQHKAFYEEIFNIEGVLTSPFLIFGVQNIDHDFDSKSSYRSFKEYMIKKKRIEKVVTLDYLDENADILHDMNKPFDQYTNMVIDSFKVVCDIGCLEHVFNTAQCMKNCLDMVSIGGLYILHTPVNGYYGHGIHTFNPEALETAILINGFKVEYLKFSSQAGLEVPSQNMKRNVQGNIIMWMVARRIEKRKEFINPMNFKHRIFEEKLNN